MCFPLLGRPLWRQAHNPAGTVVEANGGAFPASPKCFHTYQQTSLLERVPPAIPHSSNHNHDVIHRVCDWIRQDTHKSATSDDNYGPGRWRKRVFYRLFPGAPGQTHYNSLASVWNPMHVCSESEPLIHARGNV